MVEENFFLDCGPFSLVNLWHVGLHFHKNSLHFMNIIIRNFAITFHIKTKPFNYHSGVTKTLFAK